MIITYIPDLAGDEGVLAEIPNIEVKSIEFRLFLTNKRIILAEDSLKRKPPVVVPLQAIRNISTGTNFSDDPVIKISVSAPNGSQKKMVLSFKQEFTGVRDKERDQLKKVLEGVVSESQMTIKTPSFNQPGGQSGAGSFGSVHQGGFMNNQNSAQSFNGGSGGGVGGAGGVILKAANVLVKSQEYTVELTNEKITLVDPNRPQKPSVIPISSIRSAEGETGDNGEPAIGLLVEAGNGNIRRMVLKFSQWYDKNRFLERETFVRAVQDIIATGSVCELYRPNEAEVMQSASAPSNMSSQAGFSAKPPQMTNNPGICPMCGTSVSPGTRFCVACGHMIEGESFASGGVSAAGMSSSMSGGIIDSESYGGGNRGFLNESEGGFDTSGDDDFFAAPPVKRSQKRTRPKREKKPKVAKQKKSRSSYDDDFFGGGRSSGPLFDSNSVIGRILLFITSPADAFQKTKGQDALETAPHLAISLLIFALGNVFFLSWYASGLDAAQYPLMSTFSDFGNAFFFVFELAILIAIITVIYGILLHVSLGLLGFRSEVNDGLRISAYSATAFIAGGIIPLAGLFIAPLWAVLLQVIGIRENFNTSGMQALIAALIPAFAAFVVFYIFISSGDSNFSIFGGA